VGSTPIHPRLIFRVSGPFLNETADGLPCSVREALSALDSVVHP
jgi:hypothetical protein